MEIPPRPLTAAPVASTSTGAGAPVALLRGTEYCTGMTEADMATVAELMRPLTYQAGQLIFSQGTPPDGLYVLEQGEALFWTRIGDRRKDLLTFKSGQTLCNSALFETSGRLATCEALADSKVWVLDLHAYQGLRARRHESVFRLLGVSAGHLSHAFIGSLGFYREMLGMTPVPGSLVADVLAPPSLISDAQLKMLEVLPFIKGLDPERRARLQASFRWREVKRGQCLAAEGGPPGELYLVVRGALEATANTSTGKVRFGIRGPGRWSCHESFFSRMPQPTDIVAKENVHLLTLERPAFDALLAERDPLVLDLLEQVTGAISVQFDHDHRSLYKLMLEQGHQASISDEERAGFMPRPST